MTVTVAAARKLTTDLLTAAGVPAEPAARTAEALVLADVWGIGSHGLMRLPYYLERLRAGGCNPSASLSAVTDTGPLACYDGEDGLGHWQVWEAAAQAAARCRTFGVAAVAVGRSSHCGALGVYTLPLVEAGLVGLVFSNGPAVMPPWGGTAPVVSTSPIAAGIPCQPHPAIVDLATSAVARGRIQAHAQRGEPIPAGWAFDAAGEPTTDPAEAIAGMLAPLGGAKGFALAFLVEALTGGLVGPALSTEVSDMFSPSDAARPQRISHLVLALDPARLDASGDGSARLDRLAAHVLAAGGRIPGGSRPLRPDDSTELAIPDRLLQQLSSWS